MAIRHHLSSIGTRILPLMLGSVSMVVHAEANQPYGLPKTLQADTVYRVCEPQVTKGLNMVSWNFHGVLLKVKVEDKGWDFHYEWQPVTRRHNRPGEYIEFKTKAEGTKATITSTEYFQTDSDKEPDRDFKKIRTYSGIVGSKNGK